MEKDLRHTQRKAYAIGTTRNHRSQLKKFQCFVAQVGVDVLPISDDMLCLYIQFLSRSLRSFQSVLNYVSGLKFFHQLLDMPFPSLASVQVRLTLRGLRNSMRPPVRASPMTPTILLRLYQMLDVTRPAHAMIWCLFLFLFFLFSRKSQFLPESVSKLQLAHLVTRGDVVPYQGVLLVSFRWTKTRQHLKSPLVIPLSPVPGSPLCPVRAFVRMSKLIPAPSQSPVFVLPPSMGSARLEPMLYSTFHQVFREMLDRAGLKSQGFSSHSFRRGGASLAFALGIPPQLIQAQGDWLSDAYKQYIEVGLSRRIQVSRVFSRYLQNL